jgi:apolipoprotein N-acyltransferase
LQEDKWLSSQRENIKKTYLDLSLGAAQDLPDMIIWPETSYPEYIIKEDKESFYPMLGLKARIGIPLLFGSVFQDSDRYFNSAILLDKNKQEPQIYKKVHLVPFGEYFPLRKIFFFLEPFVPIGDFSSGKEFVVFNTKNSKNNPVYFGVLICFEDTIAELSRKFVQQGAEFLVNITNDAWFKKSSSPYQHVQASVFRAVENRVYVLRAANTGVTCVIDACGRIAKRLGNIQGRDIFVKGFITSQVYKTNTNKPSVYTRIGDLFILFCIIYVFVFVIKTKTSLKF